MSIGPLVPFAISYSDLTESHAGKLRQSYRSGIISSTPRDCKLMVLILQIQIESEYHGI
jgi:hypothetical protein